MTGRLLWSKSYNWNLIFSHFLFSFFGIAQKEWKALAGRSKESLNFSHTFSIWVFQIHFFSGKKYGMGWYDGRFIPLLLAVSLFYVSHVNIWKKLNSFLYLLLCEGNKVAFNEIFNLWDDMMRQICISLFPHPFIRLSP